MKARLVADLFLYSGVGCLVLAAVARLIKALFGGKPGAGRRDAAGRSTSARSGDANEQSRTRSRFLGRLPTSGGSRDEVIADEETVELLAPAAWMPKAAAMPGFSDARWIIAEAMRHRCSMLAFDCRDKAVAVRYLVDGVWHNGRPLDRNLTEESLAALDALCGLDPGRNNAQRRSQFAAVFNSTRYRISVAKQQSEGGPRVVMEFAPTASPFSDLAEIGLRPALRTKLEELLDRGSGLLLFSALPSGGLHTTTDLAVRRFERPASRLPSAAGDGTSRRRVVAVELANNNPTDGEGTSAAIRTAFEQDSQVVFLRDLLDAEAVNSLCQNLAKKRRTLAISSVRGRDCIESLARVLVLGGDRTAFSRQITAVLNQRLIRTLCDDCKEPYEPPFGLAQELGLPVVAGSVFYRTPQRRDKVCPACAGLGYRGRSGLFELLVVNDALRQAIASRPHLDEMRQIALDAGLTGMEYEGALLVAAGVTSIREVARVMKHGAATTGQPVASNDAV
jgi:type II secretory ATPase GspE/PulE/Tfp pilus assembly ATPase PilB-like protein